MNSGRQNGFALLLILTALLVVGTTVLLSTVSITSQNNREASRQGLALADARHAVILNAVAHGMSADRAPGALVCVDASEPDDEVLPNATGPGYRDLSPCNVSDNDQGNGEVQVVIGRLPVRDLGLAPSSASSLEDIWYAFDLAYRDRPNALPINPETSPGLTLDDESGFAAVLLLPSAPTQAQNRPSADPSDYFSSVNTGVNISDSDASAFVDCSRVPDDGSDASCGEGDERTHERVIGISIDELFDPVQRRVLQAVANALNEYRGNSAGTLPRAARLSGNDMQCSPETFRGYVPVEPLPADDGPFEPAPDQCGSDEYLSYDFPEWMRDYDGSTGNDWFQFLIYHADCDVTHAAEDETLCPPDNPGLKLDNESASAVIAGAGRPLDGQVRPGSEINDYLDHPDNQDPVGGEYVDYLLRKTDNDAFRRLEPE